MQRASATTTRAKMHRDSCCDQHAYGCRCRPMPNATAGLPLLQPYCSSCRAASSLASVAASRWPSPSTAGGCSGKGCRRLPSVSRYPPPGSSMPYEGGCTDKSTATTCRQRKDWAPCLRHGEAEWHAQRRRRAGSLVAAQCTIETSQHAALQPSAADQPAPTFACSCVPSRCM